MPISPQPRSIPILLTSNFVMCTRNFIVVEFLLPLVRGGLRWGHGILVS
jgi:hypothetical protein